MSKIVLVVTNERGINNIVPIGQKSAIQAKENREHKGIKLREMDEAEAKKLPFKDADYVPTNEANVKVDELKNELSEKDKKIAELEKLLKDKQSIVVEDVEDEIEIAPKPKQRDKSKK